MLSAQFARLTGYSTCKKTKRKDRKLHPDYPESDWPIIKLEEWVVKVGNLEIVRGGPILCLRVARKLNAHGCKDISIVQGG